MQLLFNEIPETVLSFILPNEPYSSYSRSTQLLLQSAVRQCASWPQEETA